MLVNTKLTWRAKILNRLKPGCPNWSAVGLVVLLCGITTCGPGVSLAPALTETPVAPTAPLTTTPILEPTATWTLPPTLIASDTPTTFVNQSLRTTTTATPTPTLTWTATPAPTASATPLPPALTSIATATTLPSVVTPTPSPEEAGGAEQSGFRYHPLGPAQPELSQPCPGCPRAPGYIIGRVVDAGGNPLAGVRLACYNDWHRYPVVGTKGSGEYDFPIIQAQATWYVVVLDEADQPLSSAAPVNFDPLAACWYRLDWQRVD